MVAAFRRGESMRAVARRYGVVLSHLQYWVRRAKGQRLDRVDWEDRSCGPRQTRRTSPMIERRVMTVRRWLKDRSPLGEYGAEAIWRDLQERGEPAPSVRTIGRILWRQGVLDGRRRVRRPPPPTGWYLPQVASRACELDCFDTIEGLAIQGGPHLSVLTGISLHGGLAAAWPQRSVCAKSILVALEEHWREWGRPGYAQFDNDNRFTGPRQHPGAIGRVIRLCLSLQVTPVFAIPNETGFQAAIESFNGRWQAKVWNRFQHARLGDLQQRSRRYLLASRERNAARLEAAPLRRAMPRNWRLHLQTQPRGTIIFLRRTNAQGQLDVLGRLFTVDRHWVHRMVRAEVHLHHHTIEFYMLRRRAPLEQPLLHTADYQLPDRTFKE